MIHNLIAALAPPDRKPPLTLVQRLAEPALPKDHRDTIIMELAGELMAARQRAADLQALLFERRCAGWFVANFRAEAVPHVRAIMERIDVALAKAL
jgi:hypothetical protein